MFVSVWMGKLCLCLCVYLREWCALAHCVFLTGRFALYKSHPLLFITIINSKGAFSPSGVLWFDIISEEFYECFCGCICVDLLKP